MKKNTGDEPIGVIKYIYVEISQGNSLYSYLYYKQKMILFFLFSTKLQNRRMAQVLPRAGAGTSERGEEVGKGCRRVNTVQKLCTYICNSVYMNVNEQ
jgi:hypothetical protein